MKLLFRLGERAAVVAAIAGLLILTAPATMAAVNKGLGSIAGVPGNLQDSDDFVLNAATLKLVKRAFLADGTPIPDGSSVPTGTTVKFLIYVNNNTPVPVNDVTIQDVLAGAFAYQAGTIKVDNSETCGLVDCTATEEDDIFDAVELQTALNDALAGDVGSYDGTDTIDIGDDNQGSNDPLNIAAGQVFAVLFSVTMQ